MRLGLIDFQLITEDDGKLTFFESTKSIPFEIKRVFSIFDIPSENVIRADHASENTQFLLQAVAGKVEIQLDDGINKYTFVLDKITSGLYVPTMIWMKTTNFSRNAVLNVYASERYDNCKYIEDYEAFLSKVGED